MTCTCCGEDYSISEDEDLAHLTAFHRGCAYDNTGYLEEADTRFGVGKYIPLETYRYSDEALFIPAEEIKPEDRQGEVPRQGYIWAG